MAHIDMRMLADACIKTIADKVELEIDPEALSELSDGLLFSFAIIYAKETKWAHSVTVAEITKHLFEKRIYVNNYHDLKYTEDDEGIALQKMVSRIRDKLSIDTIVKSTVKKAVYDMSEDKAGKKTARLRNKDVNEISIVDLPLFYLEYKLAKDEDCAELHSICNRWKRSSFKKITDYQFFRISEYIQSFVKNSMHNAILDMDEKTELLKKDKLFPLYWTRAIECMYHFELIKTISAQIYSYKKQKKEKTRTFMTKYLKKNKVYLSCDKDIQKKIRKDIENESKLRLDYSISKILIELRPLYYLPLTSMRRYLAEVYFDYLNDETLDKWYHVVNGIIDITELAYPLAEEVLKEFNDRDVTECLDALANDWSMTSSLKVSYVNETTITHLDSTSFQLVMDDFKDSIEEKRELLIERRKVILQTSKIKADELPSIKGEVSEEEILKEIVKYI